MWYYVIIFLRSENVSNKSVSSPVFLEQSTCKSQKSRGISGAVHPHHQLIQCISNVNLWIELQTQSIFSGSVAFKCFQCLSNIITSNSIPYHQYIRLDPIIFCGQILGQAGPHEVLTALHRRSRQRPGSPLDFPKGKQMQGCSKHPRYGVNWVNKQVKLW